MPAVVEAAPVLDPKPGFSPMAKSTAMPVLLDPEALETSSKILHVIDRYRLKRDADVHNRSDESALKFLTLIYTHVKAQRPVPLCLPAFPFKSPNSARKVLGKLPDGGDELALRHLNGLCQAIGDVYAPGARLTIISDGLVYNDLLGVPDKDVWNYGEALRALAAAKNLQHIAFSRLRDLVNIAVPTPLDEMTYVANASNFRRALLNTYSRPDWSWDDAKQSEDVCLTYRGYIKFLETDLELVYPLGEARSRSKYRKGIEYIAKQMMARGDAFANAVRNKYADHVRLSIHPSTGATKLSISTLPTDSGFTTPWHCSVAYMLDGTTRTGMRCDFEQDAALELVYSDDGQPSHFREKSPLLSWAGITATPLYPSGVMIRPTVKGSLGLDDVDAQKVRALAEINSPVVLRGFVARPDKDAFIAKAHDLGTPLPWKFGLLLEVKDRGADARGLNNVLSAEPMPHHYDGIFKTVKKVDERGEEVLVPNPPQFQFFVAATPSPRDSGFTIFSSSTLVWKHLPPWLSQAALSGMTSTVSTSSFDSTVLRNLPLVIPHPTTGQPCLRFHEPWPQSRTAFDATDVAIEGRPEAESAAICDALTETLYDRRVAYYHVWDKGDMIVSDNVLMMHTRSAFVSNSDREMWRIHFD